MQPTSVGLLWCLREGVILGIDQRVDDWHSRFNYPLWPCATQTLDRALWQTSGSLQPLHLGNVAQRTVLTSVIHNRIGTSVFSLTPYRLTRPL